MPKKAFLLCFFVLAAKQLTPTILNNRVLQHQTVIFIHAACVFVGFVICSFQNLFINNDCVLFVLFVLFLICFNETYRKNQKSCEIWFEGCHQSHWFQTRGNFFCYWIGRFQTKKEKESVAQHIGLKYREFRRVFAKQKRLRDIWGFFDRRENDLLKQKIRIIRALDKINLSLLITTKQSFSTALQKYLLIKIRNFITSIFPKF